MIKTCTFPIFYRSSFPFWVCQGFFEVYHLNGIERQLCGPNPIPISSFMWPVARVLEDHEPKGHWDPTFPSNWRSWTCQDEMVDLVKPRKVDFWGWQLTGNIRKPWLITIKSWVVPGNVHFLGMVGRVTLMNRVSVLLLWIVSIKHVWACLQCIHFMLTCFSKPCTKKNAGIYTSTRGTIVLICFEVSRCALNLVNPASMGCNCLPRILMESLWSTFNIAGCLD